MPDPAHVILLLAVIFCFFSVISFFLNMAYSMRAQNSLKKRRDSLSDAEEVRPPKPQRTAPTGTVYYVQKTEREPPKRKKRKKLDIALKGRILTPRELTGTEFDND